MDSLKDRFADYISLTKPRVSFLVILTMIAGFYLGSPVDFDFVLLFHAIFGTTLIVGGTSALNQVIEHRIDAQMKRTSKRPLPAGRLSQIEALAFGAATSIAGVVYLSILVNPLTGFLAALTLVSYVFLYTPMKQKSSLATLVGAVPGALPPMGGWAAARGELGIEAWVLFAILFFWQLPHFLAIAWLYREDYSRGGLIVLPVIDKAGYSTSRHILANTVALLVISLTPTLLGFAGGVYFAGALLLGAAFLYSGVRVAVHRTNKSAKKLLLTSVLYLPALLLLMSFDKIYL